MKARTLSLFISIVLLPLTCFDLPGQLYHFKEYSVREGMSQASVFCSMQDSRGDLWFGTDGGGLCRYNGSGFSYFSIEDGLSGNSIRSLFEDSRGTIWIGTDMGLDRYNGIELEQLAPQRIGGGPVLAICEDGQDRLWVGTRSKGLFRIEEQDSLVISQYTQDDGLLNAFIFDIQIDDHQRLWLSMAGGITVFELEGDQPRTTKLIEGRDLKSDIVISSAMDPQGKLWFGTYGKGLFTIETAENLEDIRIDAPASLNFLGTDHIWDIAWLSDGSAMLATESYGVIQIHDGEVTGGMNKENGLKTNQVVGILEDDQGGHWFSTLGYGAQRYTSRLFTRYDASCGLVDNQVLALCAGEPGHLFIGSEEGLTQVRRDGEKLLPVKHYDRSSGLLENKVSALSYRDGKLWIGSGRGLAVLEGGRIRTFDLNPELASTRVNTLLADEEGQVWIGTDNGYNLYRDGALFSLNEDEGFVNNEVQSIIRSKSGETWMATLGGLVRLSGETYRDYIAEDGLTELRVSALAEDSRGRIWIGTSGGGLFLLRPARDTAVIEPVVYRDQDLPATISALGFLDENTLLVASESGLEHLAINSEGAIIRRYRFGMGDGYSGSKNALNALLVLPEEGLAFQGSSEGLLRYMPAEMYTGIYLPTVRIEGLRLFFEEQDWKEQGDITAWSSLPEAPVFHHRDNHLSFAWVSTYYGNPADLEYSYYLEGQRGDWSPYRPDREMVFPGLAPGKYAFKVRVRNKYGVIGNTASFAFEIRPPFWKTTSFVLLFVLVLLSLLFTGFRLRVRSLERDKQKLETTVQERTREVVKQKEEIESSIQYAERIQRAVIPSNEILDETFSDAFILLLPQQIVSGDFYWVGRQQRDVVIVAADCTGHGVPGAMMSMMGIGFLNRIVNEEKEVRPARILGRLRELILSSFATEGGKQGDTRDGMDVALCSYNMDSGKMYFSGAYNPLYVIRPGKNKPELITYEADRMPVGLHDDMKDYSQKEVDYRPGDRLYMFSDGYPDQFGGAAYKKFMKKRFRELLLANYELSMHDQKAHLQSVLGDWISHCDPDGVPIQQTDDILVMGIHI